MKRKLLGIGILALLVIVMMPMASAAPADSRMRTDVWLLSGCDSPSDDYSECSGSVSGPVGTFTMSSLYTTDDCGPDNTFKKIFSMRGLLPNTQYVIVLFDQPGGGIDARYPGLDYQIQAGTDTDARGWLKSNTPTCDDGKRNSIKTKLETHTYFVGLILASGG